jgi:hypothetical protein
LLAPIHLIQTSALVVGISGLTLLALLAFTGVRRCSSGCRPARPRSFTCSAGRCPWAAEPTTCAVATTRCNGAFTGLGDRPLLGDFVYYAVNLAFANPPPDVVAESRTARAAGTVEIVVATGFLAVYVGAFLAGRGLTPTASRPRDSA